MRVIVIAAIVGFLANGAFSQTLKELNPAIGYTADLSQQAQQELDRRDALMAKKDRTPAEQAELDKILLTSSETVESIWDVIGGGCSWYCGEGPYKVTASSALPKQGTNDYSGKNAHDLSFKTAWVEGAQGYGAGEYVEYYFRNQAPRITEIKIFNGYIKSDKSWTENSRVKKLKLTINGQDYAVLNLKDITAQQNFKLGPLGKRPDGRDLILRFTILDTYPGAKYDDTGITEIYFDGIDVH